MKIGIDFGTTNCTVGYLRKDGGRAIRPLVPSVAVWHNGCYQFGEEARETLRSERLDVYPIRDLKLMLGGVRKLVFGQTVIDPEEVAAELLKHLINVAAIGEPVEEAVIATPVQISVGHRRALRRAAAVAGLKEVRFVYEPTAALIGAQRFDAPGRGGLFLVVDWGGGTLDIAVIKTDGSRFEELAVGGDVADLGGTRIDGEICRRTLEADERLRAAVDSVPGGRDRLKDELERMKLDILESLEGEEGPPEQHAPLWLEKGFIELDRGLVFEILEEFAKRGARTISTKLEAGGVSPSQITSVLFAGGVCIADVVRRRVMAEFPNARELTTVSGTEEPLQLQELTGAGCVEITGRNTLLELSSGVGVRQSDGSVCVILPRGLPLKANTYRRAEFIVTDPECTEAVIDIGLMRGDEGSISMLGASAEKFESLKAIYVPAVKYNTHGSLPVLDRIDVRMGVDRDLSVTVSASSKMARQTVIDHQSGIPLILHFVD